MWKEIALVVAVLAPAAASRLVGTPTARPAPTVGASFKPACRDGAASAAPDPAWLRASYARDNCREPLPPIPPDGARVSSPQIVAGMAAAKAYAHAAGDFRKCVGAFVAARRLQGRALASTDLIIENHRILASQKSADLAQARMRAAIEAFNAYGSGCDDP